MRSGSGVETHPADGGARRNRSRSPAMNRHRRPGTARSLAVLVLALTWVAVPAAAAAADAPSSCTSTAISPSNTWIRDTISSSTDVDWFKFSVAAGTRAQLTLGDLPADYDVSLYSTCSTLLASSTRPDREFEEIYRQLPAGRYRVKVIGFAGAHSTSAYSLRLRTLAWGTPILSSTEWTDAAGYLHVVGEVLNNTAEPRRWIQVDASFRNASGSVVGSAVGYTDIPTLQPWTRSPFEIISRKPTGYSTTSVKVCTPGGSGCASGQVAPAPPSGVTATPAARYVDSSGRRHYTGAVRNDGASTVRLPLAMVTLYNARGNVRGLASGPAAAASLSAGATTTYDLIGGGTASPNRAPAL